MAKYEGYISTENKQLSPVLMQNEGVTSNMTEGKSFRFVTGTSTKSQRGYLHDLRLLQQ
jgi:hypothetical protein